MSSSSSFSDAQNTVHTISVGIIVVIVVVVLATIGSIIAGFCLWHRQKKRRAARNAAFEPVGNVSAYQYANGYDNSNDTGNAGTMSHYPNSNPPTSYPRQPELHGSVVSPRFEAPNTPAPYPEAPNIEARLEKSNDPGRVELGGRDIRSELQA